VVKCSSFGQQHDISRGTRKIENLIIHKRRENKFNMSAHEKVKKNLMAIKWAARRMR